MMDGRRAGGRADWQADGRRAGGRLADGRTGGRAADQLASGWAGGRADCWMMDGRAGGRTGRRMANGRAGGRTDKRWTDRRAGGRTDRLAKISFSSKNGASAPAPRMIDCRREDPKFRILFRCQGLCKQKLFTGQFPTICFVNQQIAWYEAYLHYFSRMQLKFDRVSINFFPSKKYIMIIMSSWKIMQQKK